MDVGFGCMQFGVLGGMQAWCAEFCLASRPRGCIDFGPKDRLWPAAILFCNSTALGRLVTH